MLAEQRQHAYITPAHLLYVLLDKESALSATLERAGVAGAALLDSFATRLNDRKAPKLDPGRRPVASPALRQLIEQSFRKMEDRGAETVIPVDLVMAALDFAEDDLKSELRDAGVTKNAVDKAVAAQQSTGETLGEASAARSSAAPARSGNKVLERFGRDLTAIAA